MIAKDKLLSLKILVFEFWSYFWCLYFGF